MATTYDAIVVGAGHNGLVSAVYLARAGWNTLVVERNTRIGGAVMSGEITLPGFIHDLYSTNQNLFLGSPVYHELRDELERHGLEYCISPHPYSNIFPDGTSLRVYQDPQRTLDELHRHNPGDAAGWSQLYDRFKAFKQTLLPVYAMPLPSLAALQQLVRAAGTLGMSEFLQMVQMLASTTREFGELYFATPEARALIATWGMHMVFGPDVAAGALFPFIESFSDMETGMAITKGSASHMVEALAGIIRDNGGEVRTEAEVTQILTGDGRVTGVELASGEHIQARHAVIANVTPTVLFDTLLPHETLPPGFRAKVARYIYGPGTMMVHLALRGKPHWIAEGLEDFAYVHIPPYVDDLAQTYTQALAGYLPVSPLLIVGQTSVVDPSRAPEGQQVVWIQVRALPMEIKGDAAHEITGRSWAEIKDAYADRVLAKLEHYTPGIRDQILQRVVFSPEDLQSFNPNLHGGDSVAGSHHPRQYFLFRPLPDWSNYRMPVEGLYMVGGATWPGAGVNAVSGYLAAQELLHPHPFEKRLVRVGAVAGAVGLAGVAALLAARRWRAS